MVSSSAQAQDSSHVNMDSLLDESAYLWYDSVYTLDNIIDLPVDQEADDLVVYSFDSLLVSQKARDAHPSAFSSSCTDTYNISLAANTIWFSTTLYKSLISADMTQAAESILAFWQNLKNSHHTWCECISTNYGYKSHLCDEVHSDSTAFVKPRVIKTYDINSDKYKEVTNSIEFKELIVTSNKLRENMPPLMDREANKAWDQIFADFYKNHSPDLPFSYFVDNPDIEVPEEIKSHYILLIEMNNKWIQLRTKFDLSKDESHEIYSTFRSNNG